MLGVNFEAFKWTTNLSVSLFFFLSLPAGFVHFNQQICLLIDWSEGFFSSQLSPAKIFTECCGVTGILSHISYALFLK
jgi:hypothetical protein